MARRIARECSGGSFATVRRLVGRDVGREMPKDPQPRYLAMETLPVCNRSQHQGRLHQNPGLAARDSEGDLSSKPFTRDRKSVV